MPHCCVTQVVRHERASVKADMWSYGILVWELISDQDITNLQPLAIAQAMQVSLPFMLPPFKVNAMQCASRALQACLLFQ